MYGRTSLIFGGILHPRQISQDCILLHAVYPVNPKGYSIVFFMAGILPDIVHTTTFKKTN
jgi:hypothetical protein